MFLAGRDRKGGQMCLCLLIFFSRLAAMGNKFVTDWGGRDEGGGGGGGEKLKYYRLCQRGLHFPGLNIRNRLLTRRLGTRSSFFLDPMTACVWLADMIYVGSH